MKRAGNLWNDVCDRENIRKAIQWCIDIKTKKSGGYENIPKPYKYVNEHIDETVDFVEDALRNGTYDFGKPKKFECQDGPKLRTIHYLNVYGSIYCQAVLQVIQPIIIKYYVRDTYSSIKGRGLFTATKKVKKIFKEHPTWCGLQLDIKKCYESVDHDICMNEMRRYFKDKYVIEFINRLLNLLPHGIAIGFSPSHYIVNLMFTNLMHKLKEVYKVRYVIEYMDDFLFVFETKEECFRMKDIMIDELGKLGFEVKRNWRIAPVKSGFDFIGYIFYPTHMRLRKRIKQNMKRKKRSLEKQNVSDEEFLQQMASYYGWCKWGNCRNLMKSIFGERLKLYKSEKRKAMETFDSAFKNATRYSPFDVPYENRVNQTSILNKTIHIYDIVEIDEAHKREEDKGIKKFAVKIKFNEEDEEYYWFYTSYIAVYDRLLKVKDKFPLCGTLERHNKYVRVV